MKGSNHMKIVKIKDDFITLGQALKLSGAVSSGIEAKIVIQEGEVKVNHQMETRRGKKLRSGDIFEYQNEIYQIDEN